MTKFVLTYFFHSGFTYIPIWGCQHMIVLTEFKKICCNFAENRIFEKSKVHVVAMIVDM